MSILIRTRRWNEKLAPPSVPEAVPTAAPMPVRCHNHVAEGPERATRTHEAPESTRGRSAEAPDAGSGRVSHVEQEFTHGRSRS